MVLLFPLYISVSERQNNDTNETEVYVGERKLSGYSSYTTDTGKNSFNLIHYVYVSRYLMIQYLILKLLYY